MSARDTAAVSLTSLSEFRGPRPLNAPRKARTTSRDPRGSTTCVIPRVGRVRPPGGCAEVGHDRSLLVTFDRDAPRGAVPIERVLVGVPAEQIARPEEKIAGVHCFGTDAHVEREWVELAAPTHLVEASGK